MRRYLTLVALTGLAFVAHGKPGSRTTTPKFMSKRLLKSSALPDNVKTLYADVPIDHFTNNGNLDMYKMRYLLDETQAVGQANPPILFYCGNEGDITNFYTNSGFMTKTLAQQFKGVVLFGEHRYYGESKPYGDKSFEKGKVEYLTVD